MRIIRQEVTGMFYVGKESMKRWENVYSLPDGKETYDGLYADNEWKEYRRHCVACPFKVTVRSLQYQFKVKE